MPPPVFLKPPVPLITPLKTRKLGRLGVKLMVGFPLRVMGLLTSICPGIIGPVTDKVLALLRIKEPLPNAVVLPSARVPAVTVVPPL